jgi:hypothetical protein
MRLVVLALMLCVGLQGLVLSVQRGGGRLHFHAPAGLMHGDAQQGTAHAEHARWPERLDRAPIFRHKQHHDHRHPVVADHDHERGDASVVAVGDEGSGAATKQTAPGPRLHDLDGVPIRLALMPTLGVREGWAAAATPSIRSFIASLPDRPPSA